MWIKRNCHYLKQFPGYDELKNSKSNLLNDIQLLLKDGNKLQCLNEGERTNDWILFTSCKSSLYSPNIHYFTNALLLLKIVFWRTVFDLEYWMPIPIACLKFHYIFHKHLHFRYTLKFCNSIPSWYSENNYALSSGVISLDKTKQQIWRTCK